MHSSSIQHLNAVVQKYLPWVYIMVHTNHESILTGSKLNEIQAVTKIAKILVQGSLYSVTNKVDYGVKKRLIKTINNTEFLSISPELSQFDLAFTLAYKKLIFQQHRVEDVSVSIPDFVRLLNRSDGGKTRKLIQKSIEKHLESCVCFDFGRGCQFDGHRYSKIAEVGQNNFKISGNMDYLYAAYEESCSINIDKFLSLSLGLQSWLYGFFCAYPYLSSIDLDTLHTISGSNYKDAHDFKKAIKSAFKVLESKNIIDWSYGITRDGMVFWKNKELL